MIMNNSQIIAALAALGAALFALLVYHAAFVAPAMGRMRELASIHDEALGGGAGPASQRLGTLEGQVAGLSSELERVGRRVGELGALARTDISRFGFVRYDAFDDTGSDLSYALALLNRDGTGVVLTSIYSRTDTRTYGKAVERFQPQANASEEELRAIGLARDTSG
jgi:hypothetical protein